MKRPYKYIVLLGALAITLASCRDFSFTSFMRGDAIASVGDKRLYAEDVQALFTGGITPDDSLKLLNSYVDQWVKQQLKIQEAEAAFPDEEERITRMVNDYRNSLLIYEYEKQYVDRHLDTAVTATEIAEYYEQNSGDFTLSAPLVKGVVVRFPQGFRQESQMRVMALSGTPQRIQDMIDIAMKNNFSYREFNDWTEVGEMTSFLPPLSEQENTRMLAASPLFELTQGGTHYFVVITGVLKTGSPLPLDRASGTIRTLIITKRKQELLRRMDEELYRKALQNKEVTIQIDTVLTSSNEQQPIEE